VRILAPGTIDSAFGGELAGFVPVVRLWLDPPHIYWPSRLKKWSLAATETCRIHVPLYLLMGIEPAKVCALPKKSFGWSQSPVAPI
jgi:hypothetical protein